MTNDTTMSVTRVLTHTHIGNNQGLRRDSLETTYRLLNNPLLGICLRAYLIFFGRNTKQQYCGDTQLGNALGFTIQHGQRALRNTRHRSNFMRLAYSFCHKYGVDQLIYVKMRLSHQATHFFILSCTAHAYNGKSTHSTTSNLPFYDSHTLSHSQNRQCNSFSICAKPSIPHFSLLILRECLICKFSQAFYHVW